MPVMEELYEKVAANSTLQAKFAEIMKDAESIGEKATKERLLAFAKEAGYDITVDEMQEFFEALAEAKCGELSDTELDQVAGGKGGLGWYTSIIGVVIGCILASGLASMKGISNCVEQMSVDLPYQNSEN